jgi:hypothetical protein
MRITVNCRRRREAAQRGIKSRSLNDRKEFSVSRPITPEKNGGDDGTRNRDLCRDRRLFNARTVQNQPFTDAMRGNSRHGLAHPGGFCATVVQPECDIP